MRGVSVPLLLAIAAPVSAQIAVVPSPAPNPIETELALGDAQSRMTVPVSIGISGPYGFIVDTGSERTVVSRELAGVLGLAAGRRVRLTAMTGTTEVGTVIVPALSVSTISRNTVEAPALERRNLGAAGILGVDTLQGHSVAIDFDRKLMALKPSKRRKRAARADEIVVVARSLYGQLIVTDARWGGRKIAVIVDTGSPITVGNGALLAAMKKPPRPIGRAEVVSVTGQTLVAEMFEVDRLSIGGIGFSNVPVAFADAAPFRRFGLEGQPALLLGMDALRLFRTVQIDFANREIRFVFPRRGLAIAPRTDQF